MEAVSAYTSINAEITPFSEKSCKGIRVFGEFLYREAYGLALLIVSIVCWIFNKSFSERCYNASITQFTWGVRIVAVYLNFGDEVINFSYNGCELPSTADTEENALRNYYGSDNIDQWLQIETHQFLLDRKKLKRVREGICLGSTLDFALSYLTEINKGNSPLQAIRSISTQYVTGSPKQAQVAQIFYNALDATSFIKVNQSDLAHKELQYNIRWNETSIIAKKLGLQLTSPQFCYQEDHKFDRFLNDLSEDCYCLSLGDTPATAHAMFFIKLKNHYCLFEPDSATYLFEKSSAREKLVEIMKKYESKAVAFFPVRFACKL